MKIKVIKRGDGVFGMLIDSKYLVLQRSLEKARYHEITKVDIAAQQGLGLKRIKI